MGNVLADFAACDSGATAMEYALIAALVAIVIVAAVSATGTAVSNTFYNVVNTL